MNGVIAIEAIHCYYYEDWKDNWPMMTVCDKNVIVILNKTCDSD